MELERRPAQPRVERLALDVLHRDELAAVGLTDLVHRADVRMIERGGGARLSQQAPLRERIGLGLRRQEFQRDAAAELGVIGQEHFGHAAGAELAANDVATELQTWGYCTHSIRSMSFQCSRIHRLKKQQPLELRNLGTMEP